MHDDQRITEAGFDGPAEPGTGEPPAVRAADAAVAAEGSVLPDLVADAELVQSAQRVRPQAQRGTCGFRLTGTLEQDHVDASAVQGHGGC